MIHKPRQHMRVAIVNDMKLTVQLLRRILMTDDNIEIAWIAYDGAEAVDKCLQDRPDMILMDLLMPVMNGVEATKLIMQNTPCPILVVTVSVKSNASMVFEAIGYGALDAVNTPVIDRSGNINGSDILFSKIDTIASLHHKSTWRPRKVEAPKGTLTAPPEIGSKSKQLVVIGSSTGGPLALVKLLSKLPKVHNLSIVIIQHIDERFSLGLSEWLTKQTGQDVSLALEGYSPEPGKVHIAATNNHLIINQKHKYEYTEHPIDKHYRPSVDVFFSSLVEIQQEPSVGVILTGMGDDGGIGMKQLHDHGWYTLAQSQNTCVVFGMPKAAIELNAVSKVVDIDDMAFEIMRAPVFLKKER